MGSPDLSRDCVRTQERGNHVHRALRGQPPGDGQQPQLGRRVQPVAGLRLDRRGAVAEHLAQPASPVGKELRVGRGARRGDRGKDPTAGRQDLQVAGAPLPERDLAFPAPREQQVRVGVHETRRDGAAGRVDNVAGVRRGPDLCQGGRERLARLRFHGNGNDPPLEARHRGPGRGDGRLVLSPTAAQPAGERRDLGCAGDQEPAGRTGGSAR
jgi:hypothetical protein